MPPPAEPDAHPTRRSDGPHATNDGGLRHSPGGAPERRPRHQRQTLDIGTVFVVAGFVPPRPEGMRQGQRGGYTPAAQKSRPSRWQWPARRVPGRAGPFHVGYIIEGVSKLLRRHGRSVQVQCGRPQAAAADLGACICFEGRRGGPGD
ncbi:hypothetical protein GCM10010149_09120 [Nonomuraea roseoviolacea subsp. roseoviolacea]